MTTLELRTSLLHEVSAMLDDDQLMDKAIRMLKELRTPKNERGQQTKMESVADTPCQYSVQTVRELIVEGRKQIAKGECCTQEAVKARFGL